MLLKTKNLSHKLMCGITFVDLMSSFSSREFKFNRGHFHFNRKFWVLYDKRVELDLRSTNYLLS